MPRYTAFLLAVATLAATAAISSAQTTDPAGPAANATQSQPAPIERDYPAASTPEDSRGYSNGGYAYHSYVNRYSNRSETLSAGQTLAARGGTASAEPVQGLYLRVGEHSAVKEISSNAQRTELRVERGVANINVHDPAKDMLILVDLPNGQVQVLKNGLYTFNANTNTVRVLHGEAEAFPGSSPVAKAIKVKENHELVFNGTNLRSTEFPPEEASADLIPGPNGTRSEGYGAYRPYGYGPYGDGFYGYPYYPYYAYGYPYGWWGYPYGGFGYPWGLGIGFGYYGGFGGFHGGGFHGGGFHGRR